MTAVKVKKRGKLLINTFKTEKERKNKNLEYE